jgi:hypothetical protein
LAEKHTRQPTVLSRLVRRIILAIYHLRGWKIEGGLPKHLTKYVIAGAPHTSNWDFVFFTGATHEEGIQPNFMGKHTLFTGIMKNFMLDMGGIPVDRSKSANATQQIAAEFERRDHLALVIAADNARRILSFGPPMVPTGNYGEDLLKIAEWFRSRLPDYERFKVLERQARDIIAGKNDV